jgi:hypothetical protein
LIKPEHVSAQKRGRKKGDGFIILLLRDFMRLRLVKEVTGAARNRLYVFESYLDLFLM